MVGILVARVTLMPLVQADAKRFSTDRILIQEAGV
jgi:hypothetical protein